MSEPDQKSPKTIHIMIYCINNGKDYQVFPDPIIARQGDHLVFYVHGTDATVDMARNFGSDIDGGKPNAKRNLKRYTGNPGESGRYLLNGNGPKQKAEYDVVLTNCGEYKDPPGAEKSRRRATNPSMIIEP